MNLFPYREACARLAWMQLLSMVCVSVLIVGYGVYGSLSSIQVQQREQQMWVETLQNMSQKHMIHKTTPTHHPLFSEMVNCLQRLVKQCPVGLHVQDVWVSAHQWKMNIDIKEKIFFNCLKGFSDLSHAQMDVKSHQGGVRVQLQGEWV